MQCRPVNRLELVAYETKEGRPDQPTSQKKEGNRACTGYKPFTYVGVHAVEPSVTLHKLIE